MSLEVPLFAQGGTYSARVTRGLLANLLTEGVLTGFAVSQRGAGANFSVDVTLGQAVVQGDDETNQGNYLVVSTATENIAVSAAPGSNSRYDIVVLQVNDPTAGGAAGNNFTISVIAGTASGSPTPPATPDSALKIATIGPIATATASITDSIITDSRTYATLAHDSVDDANASRLGSVGFTAGTIMRRDGAGRAQIANPSADADIANKGYVLSLGSVGFTASTFMLRDSFGRAQIATPAVDADIANKVYVDTFVATSANIGTGAVTNTSIGTNAVSETKIGSGAVTSDKMGTPTTTSFSVGSLTVYLARYGALVVASYSGSAASTGTYTGVVPSGWRPANSVSLETGQSAASATVSSAGTINIVGGSAFLSGAWSTV